MSYRPIKAIINLNALQHNLQVAKQLAPQSKVLAVIKANGYGHGIERVAKQLSAADGFGVASIDEALVLRQKGFLHRILLLEGLFCEQELPLVVQNRLDLVVHSQYQLQWLLDFEHKNQLNIWIKIDTGMHRLGFHPDAVEGVIHQLETSANKYQIHLMSHFANADDNSAVGKKFTLQQKTAFHSSIQTSDFPQSLANSAALFHYPKTQLDWVRPGILLYGAGYNKRIKSQLNLKPVMKLQSQIQALHWVPKGESVGYGNRWTAPKDSLIAVVAIGYGDGYPRHAPDGTPVSVRGHRMPLAGRVSMDMITIDITKFADQIDIGDTVTLWGDELVSVDEVADLCGTIGYELLCGITARVPIIEQ